MNIFFYYFYKFWPFLITLILWRLATAFWNPAGVLALIPIFYYTFVRPKNCFGLIGLLFCFLIDYRCNLPLFWTTMFCLFYAINGFQSYLDIQNMGKNAYGVFLVFIGIGFFMLNFSKINWANFINNLWLFCWLGILYIPITSIETTFKKPRT